MDCSNNNSDEFVCEGYDGHHFDEVLENLREYKIFKTGKKKIYDLNFSNLKINYKYKNWSEVCKDLNIPNQRGDTKKTYLSLLEKCATFKKEGQGYIFSSVSATHSFGFSTYENKITKVDCIEAILSSLFYEADKKPIALTAKGWYRLIGAVGPDWDPYNKLKKEELSKKLIKEAEKYSNLPLSELESKEDIQFFYDNTLSQIGSSFTIACKNLINKGCVSFDFIHCGYKLNKEQREILLKRIADGKDLIYNMFKIPIKRLSSEENVQYLECREIVRNEMGLEEEKDIYINPHTAAKFQKRLNEVTIEVMGYEDVYRTMIAYPHSKLCLNVLHEICEKESVKEYLNKMMQDGMKKRTLNKVSSIKNKWFGKSPEFYYTRDDFIFLQDSLSKQLLHYDPTDSVKMLYKGLEIGLKNGEELAEQEKEEKIWSLLKTAKEGKYLMDHICENIPELYEKEFNVKDYDPME